MGNCNSLNCIALASHEPLDADGSIVGLGALAAFFVTALMTAIAIFWGYFYDALPESYILKSDEHIIKKYKESRFSTKFLPWLQRKWEAVNYPISKLFSKEEAVITHHALTREKRTEALTKFILSLSDQQLVTGIAILISALSNSCKVSLYEFRVVVSLAWFSSMTHLATLGVLQKYFVENQVVRNFRVVGMLSLMVLLLFSLIVQNSGAPQTVSLQCGFANFPGLAPSSNFSSDSTSSNSTSRDLEPSNSLGDPFSHTTLMFLLIAVLSSYNSRIPALYNETRRVVSTSATLAQVITCSRLKRRYPGFSTTVGAEDFKASWQHLQQENYDKMHKKCTMAIKRMETHSSFSFVVKTNHMIFWLARFNYARSFMSVIPELGFQMAFGLSQVIYFRNFNAPLLGPSSYSMDFGQIVPLLLLGLPILVVAEIYYESRGVPPHKTLSKSRSENSCRSQVEENPISPPPEINRRASRQRVSPLDSDAPDTRSTSSPTTVNHSLDVNHSRLDPDGAEQQIINMVFLIFILKSIISILCGCLYNIPGIPSVIGAALYMFINTTSIYSMISINLEMVEPETLYAQIRAYRARGLGNGAHLVLDSPNTATNFSNGTISSTASTNLEAASSEVQDPAPTSRYSNEPESIPLQILTLAPTLANSPATPRAAPEGSTSITTTTPTPSASISIASIPSTSIQTKTTEQYNNPLHLGSSIYTFLNISSSILSTRSTPRPRESLFPATSPTEDGRLYDLP